VPTTPSSLPQGREVRTLSKAEVQRLLGVLDKPGVSKRTLFVAFSLMAGLGLRISEICGVRVSDPDPESGSLLVRGKKRSVSAGFRYATGWTAC
jgi:integrase